MGVGAQGLGERVWVSAVSNDPSLMNMEEVSLGSSVDEISKGSLLDAQNQDQVIGRLVIVLKTKRWPMSWEIKRKLPATKVLLRQRSKLYCDEDGLLYLEGVDHTPSWCYLRGFTSLSVVVCAPLGHYWIWLLIG